MDARLDEPRRPIHAETALGQEPGDQLHDARIVVDNEDMHAQEPNPWEAGEEGLPIPGSSVTTVSPSAPEAIRPGLRKPPGPEKAPRAPQVSALAPGEMSPEPP